jgi:lipoprotein-anchoring transpeptidase ErfK/SrfK
MPRFPTSLLISTGLLLTTMLATIPTQLSAQTPTTQKSPSAPTSNVVLPTGGSQPQIAPPGAASNSTPANPTTGTDRPPTAKQQPISTPTTKPAVATGSDRPAVENVVSLVLKLKEKRVYVYRGDKVIKKYPVAIGKKGWETPVGEWQVMEKIRNPAWTSFKTGEVFAPGTKNPLGARWIGFWTDGKDVIGFHGTANVKSIGTAASHGCVRMRNRDVKALFPLVKVGTTVKVVNE